MILNQKLIKKFGNNFDQNVKLSNYSWFNLGGPAEYFFKPNDKKQLIEFLIEAKVNKINTTVLGAGSNTLIRDKGIKGVVIKLGSNFSFTKLVDENIIEVKIDLYYDDHNGNEKMVGGIGHYREALIEEYEERTKYLSDDDDDDDDDDGIRRLN